MTTTSSQNRSSSYIADDPHFPPELKARKQWVCWRLMPNATTGKVDKAPFNPATGGPASSNDPRTWNDYETCLAAVRSGLYEGFGPALTKDTGLVVVDIEKCIDPPGTVADWALREVNALDSYTAYSTSGTGLHVLVWGSIPSNLNRQKCRVEMWDSEKMFSLTGRVFDGRDTIEARNVLPLHARIAAGKFGPDYKPALVVEQYDSEKFRELCADNWANLKDSRSSAVQSVLCTLALKHNCEREKMREEFERTPLCAAWVEKGSTTPGSKWERLGESELDVAIAYIEKQDRKHAPLVEELDIELPKDSVPRLELLRPDYIDKLAAALSNGTIIPFNFARETLKVTMLAALPEDTRPRMAHFPDMHTRQYVILCSPQPESGKGEAVKRVEWALQLEPKDGKVDGELGLVVTSTLASEAGLKFVQGESLGSAEYAVRKLGGVKVGDPAAMGKHKQIVNYDEGSRLFQKDAEGAGGRGLGIMFTTLYESNRYAAGSIKNTEHQIIGANVSLLMAFTNDSFHRSLAGSGFVRDGLLSRCTLVADRKNPVAGDWATLDEGHVRELVQSLRECLSRTELQEDADASVARREFLAKLTTLDMQYAPRLSLLFNQDLYVRAIFSPEGRITRGAVERAAKWTEHQYLTRQVLWPSDVSKDKVETMAAVLRGAYEKHGMLSHTQAKKFANVRRPGSGGEPSYFMAHRALVSTGTIVEAGRNRKGATLFQYAEG